MPLTDIEIKKSKPAAKPYKRFDGGGLYLLITPSGSKLWRLKYRFHGREKLLSYGSYPLVPLKDARTWRDQAKRLLLEGIDPSAHHLNKKAEARASAANTFGVIASECLDKAEKEGRAARTLKKKRWLLGLVAAELNKRPIDEITSAEVLEVLKKVQAKDQHETAQRLRSEIGRVFRHAIATARAESDPTYVLRGALISPNRDPSGSNIGSGRAGRASSQDRRVQGSAYHAPGASASHAPRLSARRASSRRVERVRYAGPRLADTGEPDEDAAATPRAPC